MLLTTREQRMTASELAPDESRISIDYFLPNNGIDIDSAEVGSSPIWYGSLEAHTDLSAANCKRDLEALALKVDRAPIESREAGIELLVSGINDALSKSLISDEEIEALIDTVEKIEGKKDAQK